MLTLGLFYLREWYVRVMLDTARNLNPWQLPMHLPYARFALLRIASSEAPALYRPIDHLNCFVHV